MIKYGSGVIPEYPRQQTIDQLKLNLKAVVETGKAIQEKIRELEAEKQKMGFTSVP
jgi:flagellar biosynthesis chaperone FliJ